MIMVVNVVAAVFTILYSCWYYCSKFLDWTHPDSYCMHVMLAGLQDEHEEMVAGGTENKDKGETWSAGQKRTS
jgi:hypothetical protein